MERERPLVIAVNHSDAFLRQVQLVLEGEGYDTIIGHVSDEAYRQICETMPDLIFTELWIEDPESGWRLIERVRGTPGCREIPIILTSGDSALLKRYAEGLTEKDRVVPLGKPFDWDNFVAAVRAMHVAGKKTAASD